MPRTSLFTAALVSTPRAIQFVPIFATNIHSLIRKDSQKNSSLAHQISYIGSSLWETGCGLAANYRGIKNFTHRNKYSMAEDAFYCMPNIQRIPI
jgi:hypothetical protein